MIRVVLVDDQELVRTGLAMVVDSQDDMRVVGQAADGVRALDVLAMTPADMVLMDVRMPRMDGVGSLTYLGLGVLLAGAMVALRVQGRGAAPRCAARRRWWRAGWAWSWQWSCRTTGCSPRSPTPRSCWCWRCSARCPRTTTPWPWPVVNMAVLSLAGLSWVAAAVVDHRRNAAACLACGRGRRTTCWTTPEAAARWGRWATGIAVAVPLGYAATRYAWALGIPLGVSQQLLDEVGTTVYAGAALATLAVGGAVLTLGLVQRWGEVFPRWLLGLRGRRVPVALAVVPAGIVSVVVASAGLMFVRFGLTGQFGGNFPGENDDVAAWLPEMFWPLWAAALAAATYAYWLRRRGTCPSCGQGRP